jgi:hypothetical protein
VAQVDPSAFGAARGSIGCGTLVRFGEHHLVEDARARHHQQPQVAHDQVGKRGIVDVVAIDVEAEIITLQAAAIAEFDLEIEADAVLLARVRHVRGVCVGSLR